MKCLRLSIRIKVNGQYSQMAHYDISYSDIHYISKDRVVLSSGDIYVSATDGKILLYWPRCSKAG